MIPAIAVVPLDALEPVCGSSVDLTTLLKAAGGLLAENPQLLSLTSSSGIVLHNACNKGVQLLGLQAVSTAPSARSAVYTAAVLQHAALLLLLLVSDSAVFVLPTEAVSPALLQLLHLLATVHHALIRQQQDSSGQADTSALAQLLAGRQQPVQLHIALQATMQQHGSVADTNGWSAVAAAAVQQAERTLLKCKAVELSPALLQQQQQQQHQQSGRARTAGSSSSSSRKGRLFELAGVHCCCHGGGPNTAPARHRAVLSAVQQQLLAFDRPRLGAPLQHSSSTTKQQQQQLQKPSGTAASIQPAPAASFPGLDQLLGPVIASTTAAAAAGGVNAAAGGPPRAAAARAPVSQQQLLLLWQDLLQALFPGTQSVGRQQSAVPQPGQQTGLPAEQQQQQGGYETLPLLDVNLTVDDATQADEDASVSEDSWDDEEQAWEEVQQQEDEEVQQRQQQQWGSRQEQVPGRLLAAAVDPLYVVSAQNCRRAAVGALRAYLQVLPQRCTAAVHTAAVQHAIQQYTRAAAGPAALELHEQLVACCLQVWQAGRQQCSQLSLTGRPCVLSPHDAAQQPHSSGTQLQVCAPDGSSMLNVPDWFDVTAANITPAQQLLAQQESANKQQHQQQQQQQSQRKKQAQQQQAQLVQQGRFLPVLAQLLLHRASPAGAAAGSSTSSSSSRRQSRFVLGPWMSLWQLGCGAGAYDTQAGLSGPAWVPGFNKLQPLAVLAPPTAEAPSPAAGAAAGEGAEQQAGQQPQPQPRRQPHGKQEQTFASQLKRKGGRGAGAASAPPEPVLGPEDFPTLQQAVGGRSKKHASSAAAAAASTGAAAPQQQQQQQSPAAAGASDAKSAGQQTSTQAAADDAATAAAAQAAQRQQDLLVAAWSQLAAAGSQGPTTGGTGDAAAVAAGSAEPAADLSGSRQPAGGRGVPRGGGRGGGRWPAAAAAGTGAGPGRGRHPASVREAAGHSVLETAAAVLTSLSIGLEYESLSGSRIILQPQQLAACVPQATSTSRQQAPDTSFAAAATGAAAAAAGAGAAAAAAMRDNNPTEARQHRRGGRQQQQGRPGVPGSFLQAGMAQQPQQSPAQAGTSLTPTATGSSTGFGGLRGPAVQLLLGDIPLFLSPDLLKLPGSPTAAAAGAAGAGTGAATGAGADGPSGSSSEAGLPVPLSMLQLQRIYIRTPAGPFSFAAQPRVRFMRQGPTQQEGTPASAAASAVAAADASDSSSSGSTGVVFECSEQQLLPPDSLSVLNLPKVYAAPIEWTQAADPSAAALAAATDKEEAVTAAVSSAATASDNAGPPAASEEAAPAAVGAGSSSSGSPAGDLRVLPEGNQSLEPLIPVQLGLHQGQAGVGAAAGAAGWSAVLCAGWLYPVGCGAPVSTALTAVGGEGAVK